MSTSAITSVFNDGVVAEQFERYRQDPASVDESWRQYFRIAESLFGGERAPVAAATAGVGYDIAFLRKVAAGGARPPAHRRDGPQAGPNDTRGATPTGLPSRCGVSTA